MKKLKIVLLALVVMAIPLLAFVGTTHAGDFRSGDNAIIGKDEVIDHTLFIAGNNVEINGEVKGDIFCAGQNITVNAKVDGDVLCAGMNVRVGGTVNGDVRLAGQVVTLAGDIARNASLAGSTVTTEETSKVGGDLSAGGSVVTLNGQVVRDANASGETVTMNNMIGRHAMAATDNLTVNDRANIMGDITYYSHNKLRQAGSAHVGGKVMQKEPMMDEQQRKERDHPVAAAFTGGIMFLATMLVLAMVVAALFPRMLQTVSENAVAGPGTTVLIGLGACIAMPILIIGSLFTVVGILFGVTLLFFWIVVMILSGVFSSYYLGRLVFMRSSQHPLLMMFVGVLIFALLLMIPIVNILAAIAAALFGSGMVVRELFTRTPKPAYQVAGSAKVAKKKS
jgi:hypothetical protein